MMKNREQEIRSITLWGAVVNIALTVLKIIAGVLGRSAAMIADGVHSLSDLLSDIVVIVFTHISSKHSGDDLKYGQRYVHHRSPKGDGSYFIFSVFHHYYPFANIISCILPSK